MKEKRKQSLHNSMFSVYSVAQATGTNDLSQHKQSEAEHLAIYSEYHSPEYIKSYRNPCRVVA